MSKIGLYYEVILRDRDGKIVKRLKRKSDSWLRGFISVLRVMMNQKYNVTMNRDNITAEDGSTANPPPSYVPSDRPCTIMYPCCGAGDSDTSHGIIVGNDNTPNTINTYALGSKISHGSGSGQLLHGAMTIESVSNPSGNVLQFRLIRAFTNNSGADITVKEFGLLCRMSTYNGDKSILLARDVLSSPITIPDGYSLTLRYIVKITVE
jgi:hypothetical protein